MLQPSLAGREQSPIPRQVMMLVNGCKDAGTGLTS
jgi:hypothetical protein